MKKLILFLIVLISFSACSNNSLSSSIISDAEVIDLFHRAEQYQSQTMAFYNDGNGNFVSKDNKTPVQYYKEFNQVFTDKFTNHFFDLYGREVNTKIADKVFEFNLYEEDIDYSTNNDNNLKKYLKLNIDDFSNFSEYDLIWIGGGSYKNDISIIDNELRIIEKNEDKITLVMTVWHCFPPDREMVVGNDYIYHLENGQLIIDGIFDGFDENENIIINNVDTGKIASDITSTSRPHYLLEYKYTLIKEEGKWKFDSFEEWY